MAMYLVSPPEGATSEVWIVAAVAVLMATWWLTEALPLAATALLPIVLFPLLSDLSVEDVVPAYANPMIFLFLGGFLTARAMERWNLHQAIARSILRVGGDGPRSMIAALMFTTAFLSMWISNTAAALVMLPIGQSMIAGEKLGSFTAQKEMDQFAPALMLGIAFSATIGGMATLIGTPPNALFAAFLKSEYGIEIGFAHWMLLGLPIVSLLLPFTWLILTRIAFQVPLNYPVGLTKSPVAETASRQLSVPARRVAVIVTLAALTLMLRPWIVLAFPELPLNDAGILVAAALVLFALPANSISGERILSWEDAQKIRWDVLILVGGGLALASAIDKSGLSKWVGNGLVGMEPMPLFAIVLLTMTAIVLLGELASNTAMAAVFLPIASATEVSMGLDAMTLVLPVALAASLGFMLPVATPPNAIVFGSGVVRNEHMLKAGAILDVGSIAIVFGVAMLLGQIVFRF